ncbi:MAG: tetratricopeptide repeat protein [Ignavibacteria bacterium]|nr:tetratricopeptide repeat protein [Ignavibacteria bacterium]
MKNINENEWFANLMLLADSAEEAKIAGNWKEVERLTRSTLVTLEGNKYVVRNNNVTVIHARVCRLLSTSLWKRGYQKEALPSAEKALALAINAGCRDEEVKALHNIGIVHEDISEYSIALSYYQKALTLDEELGSRRGVALHLCCIGGVYFSLSDYLLALEYFHKSLAVFEELGDNKGVAVNLGNIGNVYQSLSDYPRSLKYYHEALALDEKLGVKTGVARHLGNIGRVYRNLGDCPLALEYYHKALALDEELANKRGMARHLCNIGNVYMNLTEYYRALEYYRKALTMNEELCSKADVALNLGNIGMAFWQLSDYPQALEHYNKALALDEELGIKEGIASDFCNIGLVYATPNFQYYSPDKAEKHLLQAAKMNEELAAKSQNIIVFQTLAELYEQQEHWEKANEYNKKNAALKEETRSEEAQKQSQKFHYERKITEMEHRQELERKDHEQTMAHQRNELAHSINSLVEKNKFLKTLVSDIIEIQRFTRGEGVLKSDELMEKIFRNIAWQETNGQLERQINDVQREFISRIQLHYPTLTRMEVKIATLLGMKLTSPNIAALLFISVRTAELHRARIRRKMGLGAKENVYLALGKL